MKKKIDYIKLIFWCIFLLIVCIMFIGVLDFNKEMDKYKELYKGITTIEEVDEKYKVKADELANNITYIYDGEEQKVSSYSNNGDSPDGRGIRYFDSEKKYLKDNDITLLIPKAYFFTFIPEGKFVIGDGYGYYIRTVKDLTEENPGYNSDNYFKSVVMLFDFPLKMSSLDDGIDVEFNYNVIAIYEFHAYEEVDEDVAKDMPSEIVDDINENGVVVFYSEIDKNDNFSQVFKKVEISLDYESRYLGYELYDNGLKMESVVGDNLTFKQFKIFNKNNDEGENIKLKIKLSLDVRDGLWIDVTWLSEIYCEKNFEIYVNYKKPV